MPNSSRGLIGLERTTASVSVLCKNERDEMQILRMIDMVIWWYDALAVARHSQIYAFAKEWTVDCESLVLSTFTRWMCTPPTVLECRWTQ